MDSWPDGHDEEPELVQLAVAPAQEGERIDRYLPQVVERLSRSYARRLIEGGWVRLNEQPVKPSQIVHAGDSISVQFPPPQAADLRPEDLPLTIVYEDESVVVVDKAPDMVVHPAPGHASGTLVNALLARYPDMQINDTLRPGIVHRLDLGTSGLLVVARSDQAMQALKEQQQARSMHKAYLAVVEGSFKQPEGIIDAPIGRHPTDRKRQAVVAGGRESRTRYRVVEALGSYTLVEAVLETGRTHQIRVHFAAQNRPVLGDALYGPRKPRATFGLQRQFLHAYKLGFFLPSGQGWREFISPLPDDLAAVLAKLRRAA